MADTFVQRVVKIRAGAYQKEAFEMESFNTLFHFPPDTSGTLLVGERKLQAITPSFFEGLGEVAEGKSR